MPVIVKGIETRDANGKPYLRKDIDKWYTEQVDGGDRIQLTLFVEALALIQNRPLDDLLSYFRLAAIHSAPWCEWDGVKQPANDPDRIPGYCVHNNYTFPTWHRVYMLLYERTLYDAMHEWIGKYVPASLQPKWRGEADKWRLPYWDFARFADRPPSTAGAFENDSVHDMIRLPVLCMMPNVRINVFHGEDQSTETRPNPLYKYVTSKLMGEFPEPYTIIGEKVKEQTKPDPNDATKTIRVNPPFTYPWDKCNATTKYGILDGFDADIWADGGQNWLRANYALNEHPYYHPNSTTNIDGEKPVPTIQDLVYRLFQYGLDTWGAFSTTRYTDAADGPEPPKKGNPKSVSAEAASHHAQPNINAKNAMNLEFIHNNIHNFVGGTQFLRPPKEGIHLWGAGHMSSVFMAAFDPIFYIFHNNIDRLTAIWQMLNWEKWFDDKYSKQTKDNDLLPFHIDEQRNFWKSDNVRNWRDLGYDFEILQDRSPSSLEDRKNILREIDELYGKPTKTLFGRLPDFHGEKEDFVITVIYDRYALNGAPYKINLFLHGAENFGGPESEGFVASIYNFSGDLDSTPCSNCHQQKEDRVKSIAQVPVTAPMRRYLEHKNINNDRDIPGPIYMVQNSLGKPVRMPIEVYLHRSHREYYYFPIAPDTHHPLKYDFLSAGQEAPETAYE
ncbi:Di-copper centre-containing protein [Aspergillus egyptiacus]|nr:Di-copper centre-containing protein [Aspergillus egyptiacus]